MEYTKRAFLVIEKRKISVGFTDSVESDDTNKSWKRLRTKENVNERLS